MLMGVMGVSVQVVVWGPVVIGLVLCCGVISLAICRSFRHL